MVTARLLQSHHLKAQHSISVIWCMIWNKKFKLMLARHAKAYNSSCSCSQTVSLSPAILSQLLKGVPLLNTLCAGFLEPWRSRLKLLKSTFNAENFICSLSWSIYIDFSTIHQECARDLLSGDRDPKPMSPRPRCSKSIKIPIIMFKVTQGHCSQWQSKACVLLPISH